MATLAARIPDLLPEPIWRMLSWFASKGQEPLSPNDQRAAEQFLWALTDQGALLPKSAAHPAAIVCRVVTSFDNFDHPVAWLNLAVALRVLSVTGDSRDPRRRDRLIACRECCDRSLAMVGGNIRAWTERGIASHLLGENEEALRSFEQGIKTNSNDIALQLWRAFTLGQLGRMNEAEEVVVTAQTLYFAQNAPDDFSEVFGDLQSSLNEHNPKTVLENITSLLESRIRLRGAAQEVDL
jgi:hypothetical protein